MFFETGGDGPEMQEALDEVAVAIKERTESWDIDPVRHRLEVGPSALVLQLLTQRIAVVGAVGQRDLLGTEIIEHVDGATPVMGLALGHLAHDRIAVAIDKGMDFGRQSAARAPQASGWSVVPFRGLRAPFFNVGCMLMNTDRRGVDDLQVAIAASRIGQKKRSSR
jgi:hypothetical protein